MGTCGVYRIKCEISGRFYIGSSKDVHTRVSNHFVSLKAGTHHNIFFQRVFDKYGDNFTYSYKVTKTLTQARKLEQEHLNKYLGNPKFMNIGKDAIGGDNLTSHPNRTQIIAKMTKSVRKQMSLLTPAERLDKFSKPGALNGMYGKTHSVKARAALSRAHTGQQYALGNKWSEDSKANLSSIVRARVASPDYVNPFQGKKHSKETIRILSLAQKGKIPSNARPVQVGKKKYISATAAARALGCVAATILNRIKSANYPEYRYLD